MFTIRRRRFSVLAICLATLFATPDAFAQTLYDFNLPQQALADSLRAIGHQTSINILFDPRSVEKLTAPAVHGQLSASQAVNRILAGTNLAVEQTEANTLLVEPKDKAAKAQAAATNDPPDEERGDSRKEAGKNSSQDFRVAQVDQGKNSTISSVANQRSNSQDNPNGSPNGLSEIIVTAQKRSERIQDVPVPVTALSADALLSNDQVRLQDYYTQVPGLSVAPGISSSYQLLSIRGITTGSGTNPTVGVTVDDAPTGSSTFLGGGSYVPDIDPSDLARVEVLRGPQGTLYGASSLGGLLKFVTVDPSTDGVSGRVQAGTSDVHNGAELGYNFRGSINVPLSDTVAIRATGFTHQDPGYIDNPVLHINGINEEHVSGGRLSALWRPSDAFSLKVGALYQDTKGDGANEVNAAVNGYAGAALGDLQQNYIRGVGGYERKVQAYTANLNGKLGSFDVVAISAYNINSFADSSDLSYFYGPYTEPVFGVGGVAIPENSKTDKFTQEIRLSTSFGTKIDWLFGGFYTHEDSKYNQYVLATNPATGAVAGQYGQYSGPTTYQEYAAFTDVTYHFTDRFDVQVGGRESAIKQTYSTTETGFGLTAPFVQPEVESTANAFTYLVTPSLKISPNLMIYARLASGYRAGGPNLVSGAGVPSKYDPDKTKNYEIGFKGDVLNHALSFDASVYYIDWKDIQLSLFANGNGFVANGSRAKSQGVEFSVESKPLPGLTINAWVALEDAKLTQDLPPTSTVYGASGDRLPYTPRFSGNVSLQQDFPITKDVTGFVGGAVSYVGDRIAEFTAASPPAIPPRQDLPAYARTDLRAGTKYESWTVNLFVNNVTDRRGLLAGGLANYPPWAFVVIQPRTAGVSVSKTF
jgi:outer membrane receptor protein involved in Fe transport